MIQGKDILSSFSSMFNPLKNMRLDVKVAFMGAASVFITAVALVILAVWQSSQYNRLAQDEVDSLINADIDHIALGVYNLVRTENEAVQSQVDYNLNVAEHILAGAGEVSLSEDTTDWTVINQFTNESEEIKLPRFFLGKTLLEKNMDLSVETPVVDEVTRLVGETATIFQRMNERGDMLRVATTVVTSENKRAIGTYIPAVNPDGVKNPVISAIIKGETYHGRAYVVNEWYLTAYKPLKDLDGNLVGMLYVGVKQEVAESRVRNAILNTSVGKTGYVFVLAGSGRDRGRYIISDKGARDGEDIWLNMDSDGNYVIQEIINRAKALEPDEMTTVRYRWQNPGEPEPRWKIARLFYYEPWDWVIGTSVYEDELQIYTSLLYEGRIRMTRIMAMAGIIITALVGMVGIFLAWTIMRPVRRMTEVSEKIIGGDLNQIVEVESRDEIGILARTFNTMTENLRQSMDSLKKSEEKYRAIFENAVEGLFQNTIEGRCLSANPSMARILGYDSPEELISSITDVKKEVYVNPPDRDKLIKLLLDHGEIFGFELQMYRKDRSKIWVSISVRMIHNGKGGEPSIFEGFLTDITARKQAEEERKRLETRLTQAQKMEAVGTLAGGIAHDFNNILSAIIGFTELAMLEAPDNNRLNDRLREVLKAGNRAKDLVKQILAFSRMTETEYLPIELRSVIKESLKMLRSVIPSTIEIKQDLSVSGQVMSHPTQINQIMMNLCTNAAHAMDESGGILEVRLKDVVIDNTSGYKGIDLSPGPYFVLSIRDTGKGIPPEIMEKIFEPYFTTKELGHGTGLGLSVVHGIVKSHNGAITCKNLPDKGAVFDVYLPMIRSDQPENFSLEQRPLRTGNERILFIDDEQMLIDMATQLLTSQGYSVVAEKSSINALELFREDPDGFDLVITDMTMPGMTGARLAKELIAIRPDIPVVLCTGYNEHISEESAKEIGISEFILKPLNLQRLTEAIRKALDKE